MTKVGRQKTIINLVVLTYSSNFDPSNAVYNILTRERERDYSFPSS